MTGQLLKECYLSISIAFVFGIYWPWAETNEFALRPFMEGTAAWLIIGLAPVAMSEWLCQLFRLASNSAKALVRSHFSTYP